VPWITHPSCRGSSLGTRVGSMGLIPKPNNSLHNGRAQDPQDRRRRGRAATRPGACSSCFLTSGELCTMNVWFYSSVLRRLREDIRRKRPELRHTGNWLLHDDNAPSHRTLVTREFLTHNSNMTLPRPPYSLDLAPCDFFLFPKMKLQLKGHCFDRVEKIQWE